MCGVPVCEMCVFVQVHRILKRVLGVLFYCNLLVLLSQGLLQNLELKCFLGLLVGSYKTSESSSLLPFGAAVIGVYRTVVDFHVAVGI